MSTKRQKKTKIKKSTSIELYSLIFSAIVVLPLIYTPQALDPNLAARLTLLGVILFGLYIVNIIKPKNERHRFEFIVFTIFPIFFLYLVWSVFTLFFATNPAEGLFDITKTILTILLLIIATQIFIQDERSIPLLVMGVIISTIISTTIGYYQYLENVPGTTGHEQFLALYKVTGLMGQKNQFSISIFLMLPFNIYGALTLKKYWKVLSIYSVLASTIILIITQTRSVWVATIVFIIILVIYGVRTILVKKSLNRTQTRNWIFTLVLILLTLSSASYMIMKRSGALDNLEYKVMSIFDKNSLDNRGRLNIWESTIDLSKENLLLGVGAGNWKLDIPKYYPYNDTLEFQNWRRPHNDFLWVLAEKGIIGLVLYILTFIIIGYYSVTILRKEKDKNKRLLIILINSGIIGYLIIASFTFPLERINHQMYLAIMFAIIIGNYYQLSFRKENSTSRKDNKLSPLAIIMIVGSIYYSWTLYQSELNINKLLKYRNKNNYNQVIAYSDLAFSKLTTLDALSNPIHMHRGIANLNLKKYKQAEIDLNKAMEYNATNIAVYNNLAIIASTNNDSSLAIYYLNEGLSIYPRFETSLFNKATAYGRAQDFEKAYVAILSCDTRNYSKEKYYKMIEFLKMNIDREDK